MRRLLILVNVLVTCYIYTQITVQMKNTFNGIQAVNDDSITHLIVPYMHTQYLLDNNLVKNDQV